MMAHHTGFCRYAHWQLLHLELYIANAGLLIHRVVIDPDKRTLRVKFERRITLVYGENL